MSGLKNPVFEEVEEKIKKRSLCIPLELRGNEVDLENCNQKSESTKYTEKCTLEEDGNFASNTRLAMDAYLSKHRRIFKVFFLVLLNLLIITYLVFATLHWKKNSPDCDFNWCNGYGMLIILSACTYGGLIYYGIVKRYFHNSITCCCRPFVALVDNCQSTKFRARMSQMVIYSTIIVAVIVFLIIDTMGSRERLISISGAVFLMVSAWAFSKHPGQIKWRPVLSGMILQFIFGFISIRWSIGRSIFQCISNKVATFLDFAKDGSMFVFSRELVENNVFAFSALPVIFFFSFIIQMLYYLGAMQWIIMKTGRVLQIIMGTTLCESIACIANIFLGMSESPLIIKPYMNKLTSSELHAVMCSCFASVSGTVLAAYISFGAQPAHLLTASIMSAPASLCYSKLFYPETEESLTSSETIVMEKSEDAGILDAATKGALAGIPLILGIIANIVAFISFIAFLNAIFYWFGSLVGYEHLTLELILAKVFMPLSYIMGVPWEECERVGTLIGLKTVANEFIAYQKLGEYKNSVTEKLSVRAEAIATYAICGFSNPGSVGIMVGSLSIIAPEKSEQITAVTLRAFIGGSAVCFLTACIAGMLMDDTFFAEIPSNATVFTSNITTAQPF